MVWTRELYHKIVQASVVLRRTVQTGRLQSHMISVKTVDDITTPVVDVIGQRRRDVIGRLSIKQRCHWLRRLNSDSYAPRPDDRTSIDYEISYERIIWCILCHGSLTTVIPCSLVLWRISYENYNMFRIQLLELYLRPQSFSIPPMWCNISLAPSSLMHTL